MLDTLEKICYLQTQTSRDIKHLLVYYKICSNRFKLNDSEKNIIASTKLVHLKKNVSPGLRVEARNSKNIWSLLIESKEWIHYVQQKSKCIIFKRNSTNF